MSLIIDENLNQVNVDMGSGDILLSLGEEKGRPNISMTLYTGNSFIGEQSINYSKVEDKNVILSFPEDDSKSLEILIDRLQLLLDSQYYKVVE